MAELKDRYEKELTKPNIFFENVKDGTIAFYNNDGLGIGFADGQIIYNTSFRVGMASYSEEDGASIWYGGKGKLLQKVGVVTAEGDVYYTRGNGVPDLFTQGRIKKGKSKKAEEIRIGRVEVTQGGIGIAYDLSGAEAGKVVNAGELANVYAGAMLALVINHDATNAPYSHSYGGFFTPAPPCAAPVPSRDERPARERKDAPSGIKKLLKFLIK